MAFDALDEHEQSEVVRIWIRDNALSIFIGIGLGLLLIFGWQQWRTHKARHQVEAALQYQEFSTAMAAKNLEAGKASMQRIQKDYADTAFATLASLQDGAAAVERNDLAAADVAIGWAYEHVQGDALKSVAGQRLVRLRLAQGRAADASVLLEKLPAAGYAAPLAQLRGDVLVSEGKIESARTAYQSALDSLDPADPGRADLEMKRDALSATAGKNS